MKAKKRAGPEKASKWPAQAVEMVKVGELVPNARNARTHSPKQVAQIAASIREWGWTVPILVDEERGVLAGHGRLMAAEQLGLGEVPCMVARGWTAAQKRAYVIADNQLTANAGWDMDLLKIEVGGLQVVDDFDLDLLGFDVAALSNLLLPGGVDPDDADASALAQENAVSREGDIWLLGEHRLACGDATSRECVSALLDGAEPFLMVTDPPYGVKYDPAWRQRAAEKGELGYAARRVGKVMNDDRSDWTEAYDLFPGGVAYTWSPSSNLLLVFGEALQAAGFGLRSLIVWSKPHFPIGRGDYHMRHEPCWYGVRKGRKANWIGGRKQTTIWEVTLDKNVEGGHSTQKPVECMARPMRNHDAPEVYDPFLGSGTTLIAAEQLGRRCYAVDIDPCYVDVSVRRWQLKTGRTATLDGKGDTFDEVAHERGVAEDVFG